jgi:hypothetical protein
MTNRFIKQVSIEVVEESGIPEPGDPEDAGIDRD